MTTHPSATTTQRLRQSFCSFVMGEVQPERNILRVPSGGTKAKPAMQPNKIGKSGSSCSSLPSENLQFAVMVGTSWREAWETHAADWERRRKAATCASVPSGKLAREALVIVPYCVGCCVCTVARLPRVRSDRSPKQKRLVLNFEETRCRE